MTALPADSLSSASPDKSFAVLATWCPPRRFTTKCTSRPQRWARCRRGNRSSEEKWCCESRQVSLLQCQRYVRSRWLEKQAITFKKECASRSSTIRKTRRDRRGLTARESWRRHAESKIAPE